MNSAFLHAQIAPVSNSAVIVFVGFIFLVLLLAWLSSRVTQRGSFLNEYFLGGRDLGAWAFALTFAATAASGGTFIGFPSLVYTHGWSVALWICSYMLMPLVAMGLLAKRLNQLARKTGAITIPDLIRERFESPIFGLLATLLMIFFMTFNLIAQFKGGSVILQTLLADVPMFQTASQQFARVTASLPLTSGVDSGYVLCLCVFAMVVVVYTTYGGFRAVVWTDVLQGFIMVLGILIMLPLSIMAVGGLKGATQEVASSFPPKHVVASFSMVLEAEQPLPNYLPKNTLLVAEFEGLSKVFRLSEAASLDGVGNYAPTVPGEHSQMQNSNNGVKAVQLDVGLEKVKYERVISGVKLNELTSTDYAYGADRTAGYLSAPGPHAKNVNGFLPFSAAISFFFFWCFSSAGQPSNMIRCMAFRDSRTLARAMFTVSIYYSLIYFPIVIIFCCARSLLPGWETSSDRIMPEMARTVTAIFGVPWLAGLLVAAPFAAVMSTMDSFLLMISSSVVRDIYQRWINPHPTVARIKLLSYATTLIVGLAAMVAAINPPQFLQDIVVFTGSGLATSFLVPVALALYWPRLNYQGAIASMLFGFLSSMLLYAIGTYLTGSMNAYEPLGLHPFLVGSVGALLVAVVVSYATPAPKHELVLKFFYRQAV